MNIASALLASLLTVLAPVPIIGSLGSPTTNCGFFQPYDSPSHTFMVGDSITNRGTDDIKALRPNWDVQGLPGRNVDCLPMFIDERLKTGYISRVVIALGTNATEGWGQDQYQAVVDKFPARVQVIFVNTYRDPTLWPSTKPYRTRASTQYYNSKYMANIAATDPGRICVANWRAYAANHPEVITDGVHPNAAGQDAWADIIDTATVNCGQ